MSDIKTTQVEFTGKASEYFGIWIVNLLLSLLTLGIYSAWAKVRRKKYFYHHTQIDQVGFDYHAKPVSILKGRLIAFALFLAYAFGGELNLFIPMIAVAVFVLALPWLVVRASIFNARNSSHRGLRFDFVGKVGKAAKIYLLLPVLAVLSLYLAWPYVDHQRNQFLVSNHRFGLSAFDFKAKVSSFYRVYAVVLLVPFIGILAAVAIPAYMAYQVKAAQHSAISIPFSVGFVEMDNSRQIVLAENTVEDEPYRVERIYSESEDIEEQFDDSESIESGNVVTEKSLEEMIAEAQREKQQSRERMIADMLKTPAKAMLGIGFVLAYLVLIFAFIAYFKSRIGNLVWNNTTLDSLAFKSTLRARDYLWIYVTNIIAIVLTFGLATPWAQIRLARYRASKLQLVGDVDLDKFVGDKKEEVKATGEEIADFFDVDFSFG
ncbi:MAG: YjgN family protein [Methylotenera sp.]